MTVPYLQSDLLLPISGISHGFFSRLGGVSEGEFTSLNCSQFSGDNLDSVKQNRNRVMARLGGQVLVTNHQVHGNRVRVVGESDDLESVVDADGLVTCSPGICIGAQGADCAPVLFADESAVVVGVAHAGWRGAVGGITDAVVTAMCAHGATIASLRCAIGPAIQQDSYEVGQAFRDDFVSKRTVAAEHCFRPHHGHNRRDGLRNCCYSGT